MSKKNTFLAACIFLMILNAQAKEYKFNPSLLSEGTGDIDLSTLEKGGQLPGKYLVDILLNGEWVDNREISFINKDDYSNGENLTPCLDRNTLAGYGIRVEDVSGASSIVGSACFPISAIPDAKSDFDFGNLQLNLSVPQKYLSKKNGNIAPESLWNDGIPAFLMNYQVNTTQTRYSEEGNNRQDSYAQLSPGINFGAWRLRNTTIWEKKTDSDGHWQAVSTYAERGLNSIKGRLTLGESFTSSDIFDGVPFRGIKLSSDESMQPVSDYMYTPIIRGVARTQARVEIKQGGYTIYNQVVPAGPFEISDFSPSNLGGDLHVTVWETNGNPQVFTVPYQTPAIALKEGHWWYEFMSGQYRPTDKNVNEPKVFQATVMRGLPWNLTLYSGTQLAEHYQSAALGFGVSLDDWGAISTDIAQSRGQKKGTHEEKGFSFRTRYNKVISETNTILALANYRYEDDDYNTLSDVLNTWRTDGRDWLTTANLHRKSRMEGSLSQSLGDWGYVNFNIYRENYHDNRGHSTTISSGYSFPIKNATVSLNFSQTQTLSNLSNRKTDKIASLWVSIPFSNWLGGNTYASYRWTGDSSNDSHTIGLSGSNMEQRLSWGLTQTYKPDSRESRNDGSMNVTWNGVYGKVSGNYSYNRFMHQSGATIEGGIVAHRNGITIGQPLAETIALVEAPGASNVRVSGGAGIKTDFRGYTTSSYLTPYQESIISLNPLDLNSDVDVPITDIKVVPTKGAIVPAVFSTHTGKRVLVTLLRGDASAVPFGALASLAGHPEINGIVGNDGQVYLTGMPTKGKINVKWKDKDYTIPFEFDENKKVGGIHMESLICK
ncbi:fimbrial biogenesis outer membrane usher protein [Escherichia coli]|nr:fimbrial biogenesis outer membrane usher protein [Escherichia coli]MCN2838750.1 fimbrial biogenesis outer membrane usher protein [Escherichia coli]MCN4693542.1 fimbrial biogenesis outer membrane usher protein [Escherichia coli]MCN7826940.1 fimbrial biogenesis outer membrane usher protein [Escherichia coli]